ncbi:MAG: FAD-binding oxidoreductase [Chloroflexi bacterium]|nr:FAD-binding oxidoreductase [Chloroflexota bacterium]
MSNVTAADLHRALQDAGVAAGADTAPYALAGAEPLAVALPATVEELSAAVAAASGLGAAVVPWGGGTRQGLGAPPASYDLALDLRGLDRIVAHEPADLTVTVQAGCTAVALRAALGRAWQWLPMDPPLPDRATIGGTLAAGSAGPLGTGFGLPREMVIGMRAVLADGTVVKSGGNVVKNVTGFALDRLHVGGLGTLGIIAEATFKIVPLPQKEATVIAAFASAEAAAAASAGVASLGLPMLSIELLNEAAWAKATEGLSILPEPVSAAAVQPVNPDAQEGLGDERTWHLVARAAGRPVSVSRSVDAWAAACQSHGGAAAWLQDAESAALAGSVADLGWHDGPPDLAVRISVPMSRGAAVLGVLADARLAASLSVTRGVVRAAWAGDAMPDDASSYLNELRERVAGLGGTVVVESRTPIDSVDPWGPPGDGFEVMRGLKEQYDPQRILNPGRFLGGL